MRIADKPLGKRAYGSICHLFGSQLSQGDRHIHEGQARICTQKARDRHDLIIVEEKLDGTCVAVARVKGELIPLIRAGYPATSSNYRQHRLFAEWVFERLDRFEFLDEGERLCGEWLAQAHGTRYELPGDPFVAFDIMRGDERATRAEFDDRLSVRPHIFPIPYRISTGGPCSIAEAMRRLGRNGGYGAIDEPEGCVWRVERHGRVDFLAKYVRPTFVPGRYLPGTERAIVDEEIWNWQPQEPRP